MTKTPWHAVIVRPRQEDAVAQRLRQKGLEAFLPLCGTWRKRIGRIQPVSRPMFPGYVFCRFDYRRRTSVLTTPGITSIVSLGQSGAHVSNQEIEAIQAIVESGLPAQPWQYIRTGQTVKVECGSLAGLQGILLREEDRLRIIINIELLRLSVAVAIDREKICAVQGAAHVPTAQLYLTA